MPHKDPAMGKAYKRRRYLETRHLLDKVAALARQRARYRDHRVYVDRLKQGPCTDCGGTFPPVCMDFDPVRGKKRMNIGVIVNVSMRALLEELKKCELVCSNCHRIRTQKRREATRTHAVPVPRSDFSLFAEGELVAIEVANAAPPGPA